MREIPQDDRAPRTPGSDVAQYFRVLRRKKYFLVLPTILAGLVAVVGLRFVSPVYESSSVILLQSQRYLNQEMNKFVTVEEQREVVDKEVLAQTATEIESPGFLDQLVEELGVAQNPGLIAAARKDRTIHPDMTVEELVNQALREILRDKIKVSLAGPGMYKIACFDKDPQASYVLAMSVTDLFMEAKRARYLKGFQEASEFASEQLSIYKERLDRSELELDKIKNRMTELALRKNPVGETSPEYAEEFGGESNLRLAETLKEQLDIQVREIEDVVARIEERLSTYVGYIPKGASLWESPDIKQMGDGLVAHREAELPLDLGATGVTPEDRERKREEIRQVESALQRRLVELVDVQFPDVEREYRPLIVEYFYQIAVWRSLQAKLSKLNFYISGFKEQLTVVPLLQTELDKLDDEVNTNREIYSSLLKASASAQVSEAAQSSGLAETIVVIERPVRPLYPVRPKKMTVVLLALIFGAGLGLVGLTVSEYTDTSFRTVEEIEKRLGLRVLGTIPIIENSPDWNKAGNRKQRLIWLVTSVLVVVVSLAGFYYYGKIANRQAEHLNVSNTTRQ